MIQRIQTVYLLIASVFSVMFFSGNFMTFTGDEGTFLRISLAGIYYTSSGNESYSGQAIFLGYPLIISGLASFIAIFLYRKRNIQLKLTSLSLVMAAIAVIAGIYYGISLCNRYSARAEPGFRLFLPPLIILFLYLARRGISNDEKLVKSYDRLR